MGPDPDPHDTVVNLGTERAIVRANPHGPKLAEALEMKRRVLGITLEETIVFVRKRTHILGKGIV
jgi:hypothetical protein